MKNTYWILIIAVTFVLGFYLGQQKSSIGSLVTNVENNTSSSQPMPPEKKTIELTRNKTINSQAHNDDGSSATLDKFEQIDQLLQSLETKPEDQKLLIALYSHINELSLIELESVIQTLNDKNETQRNMLVQLIVGRLIELDPKKALSFAQQYNPVPESDYYLAMIKATIAEQDPEYGFELFLEDIHTANSETELTSYSTLIGVLAKHDLNRLMDSLLQYKKQGVDISGSLWSISSDLKSSDKMSNLFDQLKQLDDLNLLDSAIYKWIEISADDLFNKLNDIDDAHERKVLIEKAQRYWFIKDPENAADSLLLDEENKNEALNDIVQSWPSDKAEQGLIWLSRQEGIDVNRFKVELLDGFIYSRPEFVQAHIGDIELDKDDQAEFHLKLYLQLKDRSANKAEQFLDGLSNKNDVIALIEEKAEKSKESTLVINYRDAINKAFSNYYNYKESKAFAVAIDSDGNFAWGQNVNRANQSIANQAALEVCEKYRRQENLTSACRIYAEGDVLMFDL
ncbi:hypothetical protein [Thalassotalea marina]|uniref:Uncharacterized protein n=1 Tax=Thalassotalea marina TaxID=1673741 RepID=A0A919BB20_9GAMM|nr:hypothetical protein [Thalassotalea marina]GHF79887.1 hypothetical protein GCM10017161_03870 [Thalassotalea marina]